MKLKGYKVYQDGKLLFDNVDIEIPDIPGFHPMEYDVSQLKKLIEQEGEDIRKGAIEI